MIWNLPFKSDTYRAIELDPPWKYDDTSKGMNNRIAAPRCHLWLWTTKDFLADSFGLLDEWGFDFKQMFTWVKTRQDGVPTYGMGYWGRNGCEYLLFAVNETRDNRLLKATTTPNYFFAPRSRHSAKPAEAYQLIRDNSPGPRASLFQRTQRRGFDCFGNQLDDTDQTAPTTPPTPTQNRQLTLFAEKEKTT